MSKMNISVTHNLEEEDVKQRLMNFFNILKEEYGGNLEEVKEVWHDNVGDFSFKAMGMSVDGTIKIEGNFVHLESNLPIAASPFKNKIESTIKNQMETLLS